MVTLFYDFSLFIIQQFSFVTMILRLNRLKSHAMTSLVAICLTGFYYHLVITDDKLNDKRQIAIISSHVAEKMNSLKTDRLAKEDINTIIPRRDVIRINCNHLIKGITSSELKMLKQNMTRIKIPYPPNSYFINASKNCSSFLSKRGYILHSVSSEEEHFPIAFSIMMHKDVNQFERLLRAIYRPQNYYCIHVDKKAGKDVLRAVKGIASCLSNVFVTARAVSVSWAQFSLIEAELACMKDMWKFEKWKYYINLSGQEFPLKTNYDIVKILKALNGSNDMEVDIQSYQIDRWRDAGPAPHSVRRYKGSRYMAVCREFVGYVLHSQVSKDILNWVKNTMFPEETFFSTLHYNVKLRAPGGYRGERKPRSNDVYKPFLSKFVNWGQFTCGGKYVRIVCIFGVSDLPLLTKRRELFANKFYFDFEPYALDCLEEWHYNRTRDEYLGIQYFDDSYYKILDVNGMKRNLLRAWD